MKIGVLAAALFGLAGNVLAEDQVQAVSHYTTACSQGSASSCHSLGILYATGQGVIRDMSKAVSLYRKACDLGDGEGCNNLGGIYVKSGVGQDKAEAITLYSKSCDLGAGAGCDSLGDRYLTGQDGVTQDADMAISLYRKGCGLGAGEGCNNLGFLSETGRVVSQDKSQAISFYSKSCDLGTGAGCNNLGGMYAKPGVGQDKAKAASFFRKACDLGDDGGCKNFGRIQLVGGNRESLPTTIQTTLMLATLWLFMAVFYFGLLIHCVRNSNASFAAKAAWGCLIFFTGPPGAALYGLIVFKEPLHKALVGGLFVGMILFLFILAPRLHQRIVLAKPWAARSSSSIPAEAPAASLVLEAPQIFRPSAARDFRKKN